jgi:transcriptional regulator with XRE-family HTH domain
MKLRDARERMGVAQEQVARLLGVKRSEEAANGPHLAKAGATVRDSGETI